MNPPPIRRWLVHAATRIHDAVGPARVTRVAVPPILVDPGKEGEFCAAQLDDGSVGLAFTLLEDTLPRLHARRAAGALQGGVPALDLVRGYAEGDIADRTIGLATINALARRLYDRAGYVPDEAADSFGSLGLAPDDRLGMVGHFRPLVAQARALGVPVTVLELRADLVREEPGLVVTLDPGRLAGCNKILATSTLLLNDTFEPVSALWRHADAVAIVGPSAGGPPDLLFDSGATAIGTAWISEPDAFIAHVTAGEPWGSSARKVTMTPRGYPGLDALLARAVAPRGRERAP
jgi:uncharacterized protein (DUF4213/DUF364 family)